MRKTFFGLAALCGLLSPLPQALAQAPGTDRPSWDRYSNARFQYSICYPKNLFTPEREADNSDGRKFTGKDGAALAVWGSNNVPETSLKQAADDTAQRLTGAAGRVTYRVARRNWVVISGESSSRIFYGKIFYNRKTDQFKQFEMSYDKAQATVFNPIAGKIAGCFSELR